MNENLTLLYNYNISDYIAALTISPDGKTPAVKDKDARLIVFQIDGKVIFEEAAHNKKYKGKYGCVFSADGELCDIIVDRGGEVLIQYRETQHWEVVKHAFLPTDDQERYFTLTAHPQNKVINLRQAAGQEGSWNVRIWDDGIEIQVVEVEELEDSIISDCDLIENLTSELEEDDYHRDTCYLSHDKAIAQSQNGRLFAVSLKSMEVIDEVIIQGHEPYEFNLQDDENYIISDLVYLKSLEEGKIISTHLDNYNDNCSTLLIWKID